MAALLTPGKEAFSIARLLGERFIVERVKIEAEITNSDVPDLAED